VAVASENTFGLLDEALLTLDAPLLGVDPIAKNVSAPCDVLNLLLEPAPSLHSLLAALLERSHHRLGIVKLALQRESTLD
jgi:hypothetical protein